MQQVLGTVQSFLSESASGGVIDAVPVVGPQAIPATRSDSRFIVLQRWEGVVEQVDDDSFFASLLDTIDGQTEESAEFDLAEVSEDDRTLVRPGAPFYWSIGYRTEASGERSRASVVRFRRVGLVTQRDLAEIGKIVSQLKADLRNGEPPGG